MQKIPVAFLLATLSASPALAQWIYQANESDFGGATTHVALTASGSYALGLRCEDGELAAMLITPEEVNDAGVKLLRFTSPVLLLRIDDSDVKELEAEIDNVDGKLRVGAVIEPAVAEEIGKAKRRVAAALSLLGDRVHEQRFSVTGSGRAIKKLVKGCGLNQP